MLQNKGWRVVNWKKEYNSIPNKRECPKLVRSTTENCNAQCLLGKQLIKEKTRSSAAKAIKESPRDATKMCFYKTPILIFFFLIVYPHLSRADDSKYISRIGVPSHL